MTSSTPEHLDTDRFVTDTVVKWLKDHTARDGVPYTISVSSSPVVSDSKSTAAAGGADAAIPSSQPTPSPMPTPMNLPGNRGAPPRPGGHIPLDGFPAPPIGDGGNPTPASSSGSTASLDTLAPLPVPAPAAEPGKTTVTYKINFEAVIKDPAAKPADAKEGKS
jgi:hypothetical protein